MFSYTWSKALDDGSAIRGPANDFVAENARCRACDYGYSTFNIPHRFVSSVLYTLPFGKGRRLLNHGGFVHQIVAGWQFTTITPPQSGSATETSSWDSAGVVFSPNGNRTNCVA